MANDLTAEVARSGHMTVDYSGHDEKALAKTLEGRGILLRSTKVRKTVILALLESENHFGPVIGISKAKIVKGKRVIEEVFIYDPDVSD